MSPRLTRLDLVLLAVIVLILAVHGFATAFSWYFVHPWVDIPMHIAGGFWLGLLFFYLFTERRQVLPRDVSLWPTVFLCLGFVALVGIGWELYEYIASAFLGGRMDFGDSSPGAHFDTLKDLFDDLVGGGLAVGSYYLFFRLIHSK